MKTDTILTPREAQVVRLYAEGYIGKEIANILKTSYYTVVNHTQNVYEKLGIRRSTNALVSWWFCMNFNISLNTAEVTRRIGAVLLLTIFLSHLYAQSNDLALRNRECRRGRRNEQTLQL